MEIAHDSVLRPRRPRWGNTKYLLSLLAAVIASPMLAVEVLDLVESPSSSRIFTDVISATFPGISVAEDWSFEAEAGDKLSVRVEAAIGNAQPRIRLLNAGGTTLASVNGGNNGVAVLDNYQFAVPGTYRVRLYTDHQVSDFQARITISRGPDLEAEANDTIATANRLSTTAMANQLAISVAGLLPASDVADTYALGITPGGAELDAEIVLSNSSLTPDDVRWQVFERRLSDNSLNFASSHYATIEHTQVFDDLETSGVMTIAAWINPNSFPNSWFSIIDKYEATGDYGWIFTVENNANGLQFYTNNNVRAVSNVRIPTGQWTHVAVTYDHPGNSIKFYVNGALVSTAASPGALKDTDGEPAYIGFSPSGGDDYVNGRIAELFIWNRVLDDAQVAELAYGYPELPAAEDLVVALDFDEGNGLVAEDASGNGLNAILGGDDPNRAPSWAAGAARPFSEPVSGLQINHVTDEGAETWLQISSATPGDLSSRYFLSGAMEDSSSFTVVATTLPLAGSASNEYIDSFTVTFDEELDPPTANDVSNFTLISVPPGGIFGVSPETSYSLAISPYQTGTTLQFSILDMPLQPGEYRFSIGLGLTDKFGNPLTSTFEHVFTVEPLGNIVFESRDNNTIQTATSMSLSGPSSEDFAGSWSTQIPIITGSNNPYGVATGDLNNDGHLDILAVHWSNTLSVQFGNGDGTFQTPTTYAIPNEGFKVVTADFNGDGWLDVAASRYNGGSIRVWINQGDGTLGTTVEQGLLNISTGSNPNWLAPADLNDDGNVDLVVANYGGDTVSIIYGNGDGTFQAPINVPAGDGPYGLVVEDINDDGLLDVVLGSYNHNGVYILYQQENDAFVLSSLLSWPGENVVSVAAGDLNGDGRLDIAAIDENNRTLRYWLQGEDDSWTAHDLDLGSATNNFSLRLYDLEGDGDLDLVIGRYYYVSTFENDGAGNFFGLQYPHTYHYSRDAIAADFNEDGFLDILATADGNHRLRLFLGRGSELLSPDGDDGSRIGYARGKLDTSNDLDFFSFSANAGDRVFIGTESVGNGNSTGLHYRVYRPDEPDDEPLTTFYGNYGSDTGTGQVQFVAPTTGVYAIRVSNWHNYRGEYRISVVVIPGDFGMESEDNYSLANADPLTFTQEEGQQSASVIGFLRFADAGDTYRLGNLAAGTRVTLDASKPPSSSLVWSLQLLNAAGVAVATEADGAPTLVYTIPEAADNFYYARVVPVSGNNLSGQYRLVVTLEDLAAPTITSNTLPAEGSTVTTPVDRFSLGFSEDMHPPTVNSLASYQLRNETTGDIYTIALSSSYSSGLSQGYLVTDGPLQPGFYRFRAFQTLQDRYLNPLGSVHERTFTVENVPPFIFESRNNGDRNTADGMSPTGESEDVFSGSWRMQTALSTGSSNPYGVAAADLNNDGHLDILAVHWSDTLSVQFGNGDGTFDTPTTYPLPNDGFKVVTADFNGDGWLDVAASRYNGGSIRVWINQGDGTLSTTVEQGMLNISTGSNPNWLESADLNDDGNLDLVVANFGGDTVSIIFGNGDGTFQTPLNIPAGDGPYGVSIEDINDDGLLDIVLGSYYHYGVYILYQQEDDSFVLSDLLSWPGESVVSVAVGDLNGDGRMDIAAVEENNTTFRYWLQEEDASWSAFDINMANSTNSFAIRFYDLDADGDLDIVIGRYYYLYVYYNNGDATFTGPSYPHTYHYSRDVIAADFDEDGFLDLLAPSDGNNVLRLFIGEGRQLLASDGDDGSTIGYARGNLFNNDDVDFYTFYANAGDRVIVGSMHPGNPSNTGLRYRIYRPDEADDGDVHMEFYADYGSNSGTGQGQFIAPISGNYYIRVFAWHSYTGEYRLMVATVPGNYTLESESNGTVGTADALSFTRVTGAQTASALGYLRFGDAADFFALGNLAGGTEIVVDASKPPSSTLVWQLAIVNAGGSVVASANPGDPSISYDIPAEAPGLYYVRVTPSSGNGLDGQYRLAIALQDNDAPQVLSNTLPAEGSTVTDPLDRFTLGFSEDMLASTVNNTANYQLINLTTSDVYTVVLSGTYSQGLSQSFLITDGPLQPGEYRFTASTNLQDVYLNPLAEEHVRTFTIADLPPFVLESRSNDTRKIADSLSPTGISNEPDGSWDYQIPISIGSTDPYGLEVVDLNKDGHLDILTSNWADTLSVVFGNGDGTFQTPATYSVPNDAFSVVAGDFNEDGWPDVAVTRYNASAVRIFINQGDGVLSTSAEQGSFDRTTGSNPNWLKAAYVNDDDHLDLVVANYGSGSISILYGNGDGTFLPNVNVNASSAYGIDVGDLNNDGLPDIAVGSYGGGGAYIAYQQGDGSFTLSELLSWPGQNVTSVAVGDLDGDGLVDLVAVSNAGDRLRYWLQQPSGAMADPIEVSFGWSTNSYSVRLYDLDDDDDLDILVGRGQHVARVENLGGGQFGRVSYPHAFSTTRDAMAGDFNEDGMVDLIGLAQTNDVVRLFLARGSQYLPADGDDGSRTGYGRGKLYNNSDNDYYSFSARAGDRVIIGTEHPGNPTNSGLQYRVYRGDEEDEDPIINFYGDYGSNSGTGQTEFIAPISGTYIIRVDSWHGYTGEYRIMVTTIPSSAALESENNGSTSNADTLPFSVEAGVQSASVIGFLRYGDAADYFSLGNLAGGTQVSIDATKPPSSNLVWLLSIVNSSNVAVAVSDPGASSLEYSIPGDASGLYYVRMTPVSGNNLTGQYRLDIELSDLEPPSITGDSLPAENSPTSGIISSFTISFSEDMSPASVTNMENYSLLHAGADGLFETSDDMEIGLSTSGYTSGLSVTLQVSDTLLQAGKYRFTAGVGLSDKALNPITSPYIRYFTVLPVEGYAMEQESNDTMGTASPMGIDDTQPGLLVAGGRGYLTSNSDWDYWTFEGLTGDQIIVYGEGLGSNSGLRYRLYSPSGVLLYDQSIGTGGAYESPNITLSEDGAYFYLVTYNHSFRGEYRFRMLIARPPVQLELEPNNGVSTATPITLMSEGNNSVGSVAGLIRSNGGLDYFDLGEVPAGTTIFLSTRLSASSTFVPVVSLYNSSGSVMPESGGGRVGDGVAQVDISVTDHYYALARTAGSTGGLLADYILDVLVAPMEDVSFPNLQPAITSSLPATGLKSGDSASVSFRVSNVGNLSTPSITWIDRIVISSDIVYGNSDDIEIGVVSHPGPLAEDSFYDVTTEVSLPDGVSGDFYLIVRTDHTNTVNEFVLEGDNEAISAGTISIELADYPDLVLENFQISEPVDGVRTASWLVANRGAGATNRSFVERVRVRNASNGTIAQQEFNMIEDILDVNDSIARSFDVVVPSAGIWIVEVALDTTGLIYEYNASGHAAAEANNTASGNFQIIQLFTISVDANPPEAGSVSGAGTFTEGTLRSVTATVNAPYIFLGWFENGFLRSNSLVYSFSLAADRNLTARFALPTFLVTTPVSPAGSGVVTGGGSYQLNQTATLQATPQPGYLFQNWTEGVTVLGTQPTLEFAVTGSRTITANFAEANPTHNILTDTSPSGIASVTGAGTVGNGVPVVFSAPATVVDGDTEYVFSRFTLNGVQVSTSATFNRTFSTLDPQDIQVIAEYVLRSLKPVVTQVSANYGNPAPKTNNFRLNLRFDRAMDPNFKPEVILDSDDAASVPSVPTTGSWTSADTFAVAPITFGDGNSGNYTVIVSGARDTQGRIMDVAVVHGFSVDTEPPALPVLVQEHVTNSTARVGWPAYLAPGDLHSYRVYRQSSAFTSTVGLSPVASLSPGSTVYTFGGLSLDTDYHVAVVPVDIAGNALTDVPSFTVRIESTIPQPVDFDVVATATDAARVVWTFNTANEIGFQGFRVYRSNAPFTSIEGMTPIATLGSGIRKFDDPGLDRSLAYHYAVVGYNRLDESIVEVQSEQWVDPLSGELTTDFTVNEAEITIQHPVTIGGGATFTVPAGATVRFAPGAGITVSNGRLLVQGTIFEPVIFTSTSDVEGGLPSKGDWAGVTLADGTRKSELRNLILRFGEGLTIAATPAGGHTIEHLASVWNSGAGLTLANGVQTATEAYLVSNDIGAQTDGGQLTLTGSVLNNLNANAANNAGSLIATGNWWGSGNPTTIASKITGVVDTSGHLAVEPVLTHGIRTANGETSTSITPTPVHIASLNATAYRISEDSSFSGVLYLDMPKDDLSPALYNDAAVETLFPLSEGAGVKTLYVQFRTATGGESEPEVLEIDYVTEGPSITGFTLMEGQTISRPIQVSASAVSPIGLQSLKLLVDDVEVASSPTSPLQILWDIRTLTSGVHRVRLEARDLSGSLATYAINVVINPVAPPQPIITSPASDILTTNPAITVSGTAEAFANIRITSNGAVIGTTQADAAGNFTVPDCNLFEGSNAIVASAYDATGSTQSLPVFVSLDTGAPSAVTLLEPEYLPGDGLFLDWDLPTSGEIPISYRVFWHSSPFADPASASGQSSQTLASSAKLGASVPDGLTYFAVVGYDAAGNASAMSNLVSFLVDQTPPSFVIAYSKPSPIGPGPLTVTVTASEPLEDTPLLLLRGAGNSLLTIKLTPAGSNVYTAEFPVSTLSARTGPAQMGVTGTDLAGNVYVGPPQDGANIEFDLTKPTGVVATSLPSPIQTLFGDVTLSVTLTLSELPAPDADPTLEFALPNGGGLIDIPLSGAGLEWSGQFTLTSAMGNGEGAFLLNVIDTVGNEGTVITSGEKLEIYNTEAPSAPAVPANLVLTPQKGGEMHLTWNASDKAHSYRIYREAGAEPIVPVTLVADNITTTSYTDLPPEDGVYRYVVTAYRLGAESSPSGIRAGPSDRTPPPAPIDTFATLGVTGVNVTWTPGEGETPVRWIVYRNGTPIRTINNPATTSFRDSPPRGEITYVIAAADTLGNEATGPADTIELLVGAVSSITATVDPAVGVHLDWSPTDGTTTGYNVYRNGSLQTATPIAASEYLDTLSSEGETVVYGVSAVNANGDESPQRLISVHPVTAVLELNPSEDGEQASISNYFDHYRLSFTVGQDASEPLALQDGEIIRVVEGDAPIVELFATPSTTAIGATQVLDIAVPAPKVIGVDQAASITLRGAPDSGGSTVDYRFTVNLAPADAPVLMISLASSDVPLAGGLTDFSIRVFNRGHMPADLVLTRGNNSLPGDLVMEVVADGVVVSSNEFASIVPGMILNGDGEGFLRVEPGESVDIPFPEIFVPEALSNVETARFRARFDAIYHQAGSQYERVAGPIQGSMDSSLVASPYYGTAATDKLSYANNQPVVLYGQAIDRDTGDPVPNVPLAIGMRIQGATLYDQVVTDEEGNYVYEYTPTFGLAGELVFWATHPDIVDQLDQVRIGFFRLLTRPNRAEIIMSKNDTLDFNIGLMNLGNIPVSDIQMSFRAWVMDGEDEVEIDSITATVRGSLPALINGKKEASLPLQLQAELDAPDEAAVEFTFSSAEGAAITFSGTVSLRPALALLTTVTPTKGYAEAGVTRGDIKSVEVTVENRGLRALTGVKMTPPTGVPWIQVAQPTGPDGKIDLPDIAVGGSYSFTVVFAPPEDTVLGYYNDQLTISGENAVSDYKLNLFGIVTGSPDETGSVLFTVLNSIGDPVPNTSVWLRSAIFGNEVGPVLTDAVGQVLVEGLSEGNWHWKTAAPGHAATQGVVQVVPDQVVGVDTEVLLNLVTVKFSVVPVPFTDYYEIKLEQTFQTRTPIPNLILSPPHTDLQVEPGWSGTLLYTLRNEGLRSAFEVRVEGMTLPTMRLTPLVEYIPELFAQEEVQIPVYFEYFGSEEIDASPGRSSAEQLSQIIGLDGAPMAASSPIKAGALDTARDIYDCYKEFKYGTIVLKSAAFIDCASGETYNVGVNATINVDDLLGIICDDNCPDSWTGDSVAGKIADNLCGKLLGKVMSAAKKKTKVIDIVCKASNIIKAIACAAAHLPEGKISGKPISGGGGGGAISPGGGFGGWSFETAQCFMAGTPITLADGTVRSVEDLIDGVEVLSDLSGRSSTIGQIQIRQSNHVREITFQKRNGEAIHSIRITHDHRMWIDGVGWMFAGDVLPGAWLHGVDGELYEVINNDRIEGIHPVYSIHLIGDRALYAAGVLVEDQCFNRALGQGGAKGGAQ